MPGQSNNSANRDDDQKFTGHFLEPACRAQSGRQEGDLGIYHAGARMYDPAIGRFLGVDAMRSDMPGWNTYHYSFNNPVRFVDPDGNSPYEFHTAIHEQHSDVSSTHTLISTTRETLSETTNIDGTVTRDYKHTTTVTSIHKAEDGQVTVGETQQLTANSTATYRTQDITEGGETVTQYTQISNETTGSSYTTGAEGSAAHQSNIGRIQYHQQRFSGRYHDQSIRGRVSATIGAAVYAIGNFSKAGAVRIAGGLVAADGLAVQYNMYPPRTNPINMGWTIK